KPVVHAAQHGEHNHSETSTTSITIYTDSQVAYSECRHASNSTSDRVHKIDGIASRLHSSHYTQLQNQRTHNEARAAALSKPSAPIVPTIYSGSHFDSSQPDDTQPDLTERAALAKRERKKMLRNLRTTASLFKRHYRMIPPMPSGASRKAQTLVLRTAINTLHRTERYKTSCSAAAHPVLRRRKRLETSPGLLYGVQHPSDDAARLGFIPVADQPNTFEDWVISRDKPPPTVRLLWN
ncbi:hypothetical protein HPB47_026914, partial [Ixodes persulcatus]